MNTAASSVTGRRRVLIHKALSADHEVRLIATQRRDHASKLARSAAGDGADAVVVLGGDGTLNEAANGLAGSDTALAVLPGGSTNVFARILGLPDDPIDAVAELMDALDRSSIEPIGLGSVNGRYFLFHCGIGFDAAVVAEVERRGPWKRWAGHPLFIYAAATTWLRGVDRRRAPLEVRCPAADEAGDTAADGTADGDAAADGGPIVDSEHEGSTSNGADGGDPDGDNAGGGGPHGDSAAASEDTVDRGFLAMILNANPYTFLGDRPLDLVPEASLDAPLAAVTVTDLSLSRLLPLVGRALGSGDVRGCRGVRVRTGLRSATVHADPPVPYQIDGDHLGSGRRFEIRWAPEALNLVVPPRS